MLDLQAFQSRINPPWFELIIYDGMLMNEAMLKYKTYRKKRELEMQAVQLEGNGQFWIFK